MVNDTQAIGEGYSPETEKTLSQAAIGRALGLAPSTMTKHKAAGMPMTSIDAARAWYKAHTNIAQRKVKTLTPPPPEPTPTKAAQPPAFDLPPPLYEDFDSARTREKIAVANLAEMEEKAKRRELLPLEKAQKAAFEIGRQVRDALNAATRRIAPELATAATVTDCEEILRREHAALLQNLSTALAKQIAAPAPEATDATP